MTLNRNAIEVSMAQEMVASRIETLGTEKVSLTESIGRRLAADIYATHPVPHFKRSGMDGYAIRANDTYGASPTQPIRLKVNQMIPCGAVPHLPVGSGEASRIMTGAPVPHGADTVIMLEMTEELTEELTDGHHSFVEILQEIPKGSNISEIGEEIQMHDFLLETGKRIHAGEAALLAAFGYHQVPVFRKPKIAIFTTGTELLSVEEQLAPGKIRNSNLYLLYALVKSAGGEILAAESIPDNLEKAKELVYSTIEKTDLILTSGGVSVGDYDIMAQLFEEWSGERLFNKVKMRPGSVTTAGILNRKFVFGLSGNPGACFVGFELFVRPVLYGMQGKKETVPSTFTAFFKGDDKKGHPFSRLIRGRSYLQDGKVYVKQAGIDKSSITISIRDANCLIIIPPGEGVQDGELVTAIRLEKPE